MFTEARVFHEEIIESDCLCKLAEPEFARKDMLPHNLPTAEKPGVVVASTKLRGYARLAAIREDVITKSGCGNNLSRIAIVGYVTCRECNTGRARPLTRVEMRWFDKEASDAAEQWVGGA